jgi:hypothetical protein
MSVIAIEMRFLIKEMGSTKKSNLRRVDGVELRESIEQLLRQLPVAHFEQRAHEPQLLVAREDQIL